MGRAVCIIGFERRDKCPHGRGKKLGRMARNEWRFENEGTPGEWLALKSRPWASRVFLGTGKKEHG